MDVKPVDQKDRLFKYNENDSPRDRSFSDILLATAPIFGLFNGISKAAGETGSARLIPFMDRMSGTLFAVWKDGSELDSEREQTQRMKHVKKELMQGVVSQYYSISVSKGWQETALEANEIDWEAAFDKAVSSFNIAG
ncbi:hypothetical protein AAF712_008348 [Marasmius tenuissimus]|uniref:Uncharacterized protein n=1 Tax=Marasmius tenuissimus TaxID=585030 RepID=A0ABR2ZSL5_9AGAR